MLVAVCSALAAITHLVNGQRLRAASSDFREFTLVRVETSESRSPAPMRRTVLIAHRADGSRVEGEIPFGDVTHPHRRFVTLVPERIRVEVNDKLGAKTTFYFTGSRAPRRPAPDSLCNFTRIAAPANPLLEGEAEVLGFKTVGIRTELRVGDNSYLRTEWKAPELDCAVLKLTEARRDTAGNVTGHFEMHAATVTLGPPDSKLFDVPQHYLEKSPSQMHDAVLATAGTSQRPVRDNVLRRLARDDEQYMKNHLAAGYK